jgi:hypothetical protein
MPQERFTTGALILVGGIRVSFNSAISMQSQWFLSSFAQLASPQGIKKDMCE